MRVYIHLCEGACCSCWSEQVTLTSPESVTCWCYSWEVDCLQGDDGETKVRGVEEDWVMMSKRVRWRKLCLGASNWVLIELAPKERWVDGERELEWIGPHVSMSCNTNVSLLCRWVSWQQIRIGKPWFKSFRWNESVRCHFNENTKSVVSLTFQMKLVPLETYYKARHREQWLDMHLNAGLGRLRR